MKSLRSLSIFAFVTSVLSVSAAAHAHSSHSHEQESAQTSKPSACEQLSNAGATKDPAAKALQARCDAAKQSAGAADKKVETPSKK